MRKYSQIYVTEMEKQGVALSPLLGRVGQMIGTSGPKGIAGKNPLIQFLAGAASPIANLPLLIQRLSGKSLRGVPFARKRLNESQYVNKNLQDFYKTIRGLASSKNSQKYTPTDTMYPYRSTPGIMGALTTGVAAPVYGVREIANLLREKSND
jgi:hypothetical protein